MRSLFNNPWFIAALGAVAAVYLGWTLVWPLLGDDPATFDDPVPPLGLSMFGEEEADAASSDAVSRELAVDKRSEIAWLHDVERDPFAGTLIGQVSATGEAVAEDEALPRVAALFVGDGVRAAVVNDKLVRVGDEVARYRVTAIGAEHVQVTRGGRSYRLEPDV